MAENLFSEKTIFFVRHAEPDYRNHDDMSRELTEKGRADAGLVTEFLSGKNVTAVCSSPYRRAIETLTPFALAFGHRILPVDDFRERKVGEGWIEDFREFSERQWADFSYRLPGGESLSQVQSRNIAALEKLLKERPDGSVTAVGSHGTALSCVIHYYQPRFTCSDFYRLGKLPWIVEFRFRGLTCVSAVSFDLFEKTQEQLL